MESEDLVSQFAMLTGASPSETNTYLEMCNWDLERAVNMFMENNSDSGSAEMAARGIDGPTVVGSNGVFSRQPARKLNNESSSSRSPIISEADLRDEDESMDGVRAPIPQRTEVLVDEPAYGLSAAYEAIRIAGGQMAASSASVSSAFGQPSQGWGIYRNRTGVIEQLMSTTLNAGVSPGDEQQPIPVDDEPAGEPNVAGAAAVVAAVAAPTASYPSAGRRGRKRNLVELFSPPYELIHQGPFDSARENGRKDNKWVLVDVQDSQEFRCQCLNRDLWKNETVAGVLRANFIFWQVNNNHPMGQRFQQFYPVKSLPFVGLVDPTTGELLQTFRRLTSPEEFIEDVWEFLAKNPNPTCNNLTLGPAPKRARRDEDGNSSGEGKIVAQVNDMKITESHLSEMSEAEQLRMAMERSREQFMNTPVSATQSELVGQLTDSDTTDSLLTARDTSPIGPSPSLDDDDRTAAAVELEETIRGCRDPQRVCQLVVRLPQGERQTVTLPASAPIKALKLFAESRGYSMTSNELVALYPTRNLSQMKAFASLESAKLFPKDTVFVQEK